jgi:hypothetical protein
MKSSSFENGNLLQELASKCPNSVSCIETGCCGEREMCKVQRAAGENILFLEGDMPFGCPYLLPFGYGHLCTCPVHAKLHKQGMRTKKSNHEEIL